MELVILLFMLTAIALLALRFGADTRDGFHPSALDLGRAGIAWIPAPLDPAPAASPEPTSANPPLGVASPYPTLAAIDQALGAASHCFAADADAAYLERRARDLTGRYWSDLAWLTGMIDQSRLETVCLMLERERRANGARILVLPEQTPIAS